MSDEISEADSRFDDAYRGHRVVDDHHRPIGKVTDVIYDETGTPKWAVVSPGVFRAEHFLPLDNTYLSLEGNLVVPLTSRALALAEGRAQRAVIDHGTRARAVYPARRLTRLCRSPSPARLSAIAGRGRRL